MRYFTVSRSLVAAVAFVAAGCGGAPPVATKSTPSAPKLAPFAATQIAAGREHACARTNDGNVFCWGANGAGQLGDGTTTNRLVPTKVAGLSGVTQVACGDAHSCARLENGTIRCWGDDTHGELGDGTTKNATSPVEVAGLSGVNQVELGGAQSCARKANGFIVCWGETIAGATTKEATPVFGMTEASELGVGALHACARISDKSVQCWGANNFRQLGVPRAADRGLPVNVPVLTKPVQLSLGRDHGCAHEDDGSMLCWGGGASCVPGEWSPGRVLAVKPARIPGLENVTSIAAGGDQACAIEKEGTVACARPKPGGGDDRSCVAERIAGLEKIASLALGDGFGCARDAGDAVWCWGKNASGQLGDGTTTDRPKPVRITR